MPSYLLILALVLWCSLGFSGACWFAANRIAAWPLLVWVVVLVLIAVVGQA